MIDFLIIGFGGIIGTLLMVFIFTQLVINRRPMLHPESSTCTIELSFPNEKRYRSMFNYICTISKDIKSLGTEYPLRMTIRTSNTDAIYNIIEKYGEILGGKDQ